MQSSITFQQLTKEYAAQHVDALVALVNLIPEVEYAQQDILAENKGNRILHGKWQHSFAVEYDGKLIGFVMAYERATEGNEQYSENTLYISELAVSQEYQGKGIAKALLDYFFAQNEKIGMRHLEGSLNYSLQTNSAEWNVSVRKLYEKYGFKKRATKTYPNRVDVVMGMNPKVLSSLPL